MTQSHLATPFFTIDLISMHYFESGKLEQLCNTFGEAITHSL